jgi:OFA family oxalate/formate antiporter-like MFS transporter
MFLATSTAGCLVSGPLCDRISARSTALLSFLCITVSIVALPLSSGFAAALACVIIYGLGYGGTVTIRPLLIFEFFGSAAAGRLYGMATATFTVGAFVGPIIAGYIHDTTHSYNLAYVLAFILMVTAMVMLRAVPASSKFQKAKLAE